MSGEWVEEPLEMLRVIAEQPNPSPVREAARAELARRTAELQSAGKAG